MTRFTCDGANVTVLTFLTWKESKYVISKQTELFTAIEVIRKLFCF